MADQTAHLWLIAGANGVGKTTFARARIREVTGSVRFVNLDEIARGLSPFDPMGEPIRAARTASGMLRDFIEDRSRNGMPVLTTETTLSKRTHLGLLAASREAGIVTHLLYFAVTDPEVSITRVAQRVREGGHDVPETDLRRRFGRSLANLPAYIDAVDEWTLFDANPRTPAEVARGRRGCAMARDLKGRDLPAPVHATLMALPDCD